MKPLRSTFTLARLLRISRAAATNRPVPKPVNWRFLITDSQRWDARSCAGTQVIKLPKLARLVESTWY